jgi:predicted transcriptional regulator
MLLPKLEEIKKIRIQLGVTKTVLVKQLEKNKTKVSRMLLYMIEEKNHSPNYKIAEDIFGALHEIENNQKNKGITAGEICAKDLVTVRCNEKVITAKKRMGQQGEYTHLPVLDVTRECVGLITSNSILKNPNAVKVEDAMEGRPTIIGEDLVITEGIEALLSNTQSCILVSHRNSSKIMGIIVAWDLIPNKESMKHNWKRKGQKRV